jgi:hypothetical protein
LLKPRPPRLISKFSMDMADWKGLAFRRPLLSADRFNESAMLRALEDLKIPGLRSSASLVLDTAVDHFRTRAGRFFLNADRERVLVGVAMACP